MCQQKQALSECELAPCPVPGARPARTGRGRAGHSGGGTVQTPRAVLPGPGPRPPHGPTANPAFGGKGRRCRAPGEPTQPGLRRWLFGRASTLLKAMEDGGERPISGGSGSSGRGPEATAKCVQVGTVNSSESEQKPGAASAGRRPREGLLCWAGRVRGRNGRGCSPRQGSGPVPQGTRVSKVTPSCPGVQGCGLTRAGRQGGERSGGQHPEQAGAGPSVPPA